jgi:hypothetical protein
MRGDRLAIRGRPPSTQIPSTWRTLPKQVQLMTQDQDFSLKLPSRLEAVAQHADEKEGNCNYSAIMF